MRLPGPHAATTLTAAFLTAAGLIWGGWWLAASLVWIVGFAALPIRRAKSGAPGGAGLPHLLGILHFAVMALAVSALAAPQGAAHLAGGFVAAGLYLGQVSVPAAHELIHRTDRVSRRLGVWVYVSILFGHHISAHLLVHHVHVATDADPNSAARGESLYAFLPRAWVGSFRAGLAAERARAAGRFPWASYGVYLGGGALVLALTWIAAGPAGLAVHLGLAVWASLQLLTSDYVQHYGLRRAVRNGKPVPVGPEHAWDAPQAGASWLMLNAPAHAAHHMRPGQSYQRLGPTPGTPVHPHSLAVMGFLAFLPRRWRRVVGRRLPPAA